MTTDSMGARWVSFLGEFEPSPGQIRFLGNRLPVIPEPGKLEAEKKDQPSVGLILSTLTVADGKVRAEIEFENVTDETACELVVAYDSNASQLVTAGLGGAWGMFDIREFGGAQTGPRLWWNCRVAGNRVNLRPGRPYQLEMQLHGASVNLRVDGVAVGSAEVTSPWGRARQAGIFCRADHGVTIRDFAVESVKPKAFVVMQFGGNFNEVYQDVVQEICQAYEVSTLRADELSGPGLIIGDIIREIATSQLIIADITPVNANVYFEVGYALALRKPIVLLAQKDTALPFDVAGLRVLFYEDSIGGKKRLEDGLKRHLDAILQRD